MQPAKTARLGFEPTSAEFFDKIKSILHLPAKRFGRVLDPFAGEAEVLEVLAAHTGFKPYAIELDINRAKIVMDKLGPSQAIWGSAESQKYISNQAFDLVWYNPPYGFDRGMQAGEKSQVQTLLQQSWEWVAWNGYILMCLNDNYAFNPRMWRTLADSNNIRFYDLGDYMNGQYHQVLVVVKKTFRTQPFGVVEKDVLARINSGSAYTTEPVVLSPTTYSLPAKGFQFRPTELMDEQRQAFFDPSFAALDKAYNAKSSIDSVAGTRPIHTTILTMSSETPSIESKDVHGRPVIFRAIPKSEAYLAEEERLDSGKKVQTYEVATTANFYMLSFGDDGSVVERTFETPDDRLELALMYGNVLTQGVKSITRQNWNKHKTYPWDAWIDTLWLAGEGGQQYRLYVPQKKAISAMIQSYVTFQDKSHFNHNSGLLLGAGMGTGKTAMGLATIIGIFKNRPSNKRRKNLATVMVPVTLVTTWTDEMKRLKTDDAKANPTNWSANNPPSKKLAGQAAFHSRIGDITIAGQSCRVMCHTTAAKSSAEDVINFAKLAADDPETLYILVTTPETSSSRSGADVAYNVKPSGAIRVESKEVAASAPDIPGYALPANKLADKQLVAVDPVRVCPCCGEIISKSRYASPDDKKRVSLYPKGVSQGDIPRPDERGFCPTCRTPLWHDRSVNGVESHKIPVSEIFKMKIPGKKPQGKKLQSTRFPIRDLLYLFYVDEAHMFQSVDTARGVVGASIISMSDYTVLASGTPMNGKASSMYNALYGIMPSLRKQYPRPGAPRLAKKPRRLTYRQAAVKSALFGLKSDLLPYFGDDSVSASQVVDHRSNYGRLDQTREAMLQRARLPIETFEAMFLKCVGTVAEVDWSATNKTDVEYVYVTEGRYNPKRRVAQYPTATLGLPDAAYRFGTMSMRDAEIEWVNGKPVPKYRNTRASDPNIGEGVSLGSGFYGHTVPARRYGRDVVVPSARFNLIPFVREMGVLKQVVVIDPNTGATASRSVKSQKKGDGTITKLAEANGLSPKFIRDVVAAAIFMDPDDFNKLWPMTRQHVEMLDMPNDYKQHVEAQLRVIAKAARPNNLPDPGLMGGEWQIRRGYPTYPRRRELVKFDEATYDSMGFAQRDGRVVAITEPWEKYITIDPDEMELSPKETKLLEILKGIDFTQKGCMIFVHQTGNYDDSPGLQSRLLKVINDEFSRGKTKREKFDIAFVLKQSVDPDERKEYIDAKWAEGKRVMICNPGLIAVGLSLTNWTTIIKVEVGSRLIVDEQAEKRARRASSHPDATINIHTLIYRDTEDEAIVSAYASKQTALAMTVANNNVPVIPGQPGSLFDVVKRLEGKIAESIADEREFDNSAFWYNDSDWPLMQATIEARKAQMEQALDIRPEPALSPSQPASQEDNTQVTLYIPQEAQNVSDAIVLDPRIGQAILGIDKNYRNNIYSTKAGNVISVNGIACRHALYGEPSRNKSLKVKIDLPRKGKLPAYSKEAETSAGTVVAWTFDLKPGYASRLFFAKSDDGYMLSQITHFVWPV